MKAGPLFSAMFIGLLLLSTGDGICDANQGAESIVLNGGGLGMVTFSHGRHQR